MPVFFPKSNIIQKSFILLDNDISIIDSDDFTDILKLEFNSIQESCLIISSSFSVFSESVDIKNTFQIVVDDLPIYQEDFIKNGCMICKSELLTAGLHIIRLQCKTREKISCFPKISANFFSLSVAEVIS